MTATTLDPTLRRKALACLREGRVTVIHARTDLHGASAPAEVIARVQSSRDGGPAYAVDRVDGVWTCTCPTQLCAHLTAVQLVTGAAS